MLFFEAAEIAKFTKTKLNEYWDSLKNFRDWHSVLSTAEKKGMEMGMEKGIAEGMEKGRIEEKRENACKLKRMDVSTDIISLATGLSKEEIDNLM